MDNGSILGRSGAAICAALLAAVLAAPGAAQRVEEADAPDAVEGPRACLSHPTIRRTKILDDRNIVFFTREAIYANQLPKACPGLRRNSLVNYAVANSRQCAGDLFQVLWETGVGTYTPTFVCELGPFVPISETVLEDLTTMTTADRERGSRRRSAREAVTTEQVELPPATDEPATTAPAATPPTTVE